MDTEIALYAAYADIMKTAPPAPAKYTRYSMTPEFESLQLLGCPPTLKLAVKHWETECKRLGIVIHGLPKKERSRNKTVSYRLSMYAETEQGILQRDVWGKMRCSEEDAVESFDYKIRSFANWLETPESRAEIWRLVERRPYDVRHDKGARWTTQSKDQDDYLRYVNIRHHIFGPRESPQ